MTRQIYLLSFASGKEYVGVSFDALVRFRGHRSCANKGSNLLVHKAWRKHGEPILTILATVSKADADFYERLFIERLGTLLPVGYNMTSGGDGVRDLPAESRLRIGAHAVGNQYGKGNFWSKEKRAKLSNRVKGVPKSEAARLVIGSAAKQASRSLRPERHGVKVPKNVAIVNGAEFKSVRVAFESLGLPVHRHKHFRDSMKESKTGIFTHEGINYEFELEPAKGRRTK